MSIRRNILKVALVFFVLFGCEEKMMQYEYTMYRDGYMKFWRDQMYDKYKNVFENGDFLIDTPEGDTLMRGKYHQGFKRGKWEYHPSETQIVFINWEKYTSENDSLEINHPEEWKLIKSKTRPFQATFGTKSNNKGDKYFIVLPHKKSDLEMNLKEYWGFANEQIHTGDSVKSHLLSEFSREDGEYYFSTYTIVRNNEELFVMNFLGETDSIIYDVTYSSLKEDINRKYTIFLDMIRSLRLEGKRFFTPYEQSTKIIDLKWPPDPEIIS